MTVIGSNALAGASGQASNFGYQIERSLRFDSGDSSYLSKTFSSAGNRQQWTFSAWIKFTDVAANTGIFECPYPGSGGTISDTFEVWYQSGLIHITDYGTYYFTSAAKFRDPTAWGHLVIRVDTTLAAQENRIRLYWNGEQLVGTHTHYPALNANTGVNNSAEHQIGNWRGNTYSDLYYAEIHHVDGQSLDPTSFGEYDDNNVWQPKKYDGTYGTNGFHLDFSDNSSSSALCTDSSGNGNDWTANNISSAQGNGHWISQVNANNYSSGYGVPQMFDNDPATEHLSQGNTDLTWTIPGGLAFNNSFKVHAYDANGGSMVFNWSGGSYTFNLPTNAAINDLTANLTSPITSVTWSTPDIQGPYVREWIVDGVRLVDHSFTDSDSSRDTPTNGDPTNDTGAGGELSGNYATLNPLVYGSYLSYGEGNLYQASTYSTWADSTRGTSTIGVQSGKWYWEQQITTQAYVYAGIINDAYFDAGYAGGGGESSGFLTSSGGGVGKGSNSVSGNVLSPNDVMMWALDLDNDKLWVGVNGTWYSNNQGVGDPATGANPGWSNFNVPGRTHFPAASTAYGSPVTLTWNFGARPFKYNAPTGFKCICTANLPDPTIEDGSTAFDIVTYTSDGSSRTISGLNMSPDLVWSKRTSASGRHVMTDSVRGVNKEVFPNMSNSERTSTDGLTAFNSDGYTLGADASQYGWQANGATFINWAWDAGSSNTTIAAGSFSSQFYDQSQNWSGNGSGSGTYSNQGWDKAFNGQTGSYQHGAFTYNSGSSTFTFDVNNRPTWSNKIEVFIVKYDGTASVNGGSDFTTLVTSSPSVPYTGWVDITSIAGSSGTLSTITTTDVSNNYVSINAIRLDGKMLVDSTVTSLTSPSVASTVRANPSTGFSIITMTMPSVTSATIGHGLNAAPAFYLWKDRDSTDNWYVYHSAVGAGSFVYLDSANAASANTDIWNNTAPTSSVINTGNTFSGTGSTLIYAWAPVDGYSKFGKYYGNGLATGPFVYTGFRPAFILTKGIDDAEDWYIRDTTSSPFNPCDEPLRLDSGSYWSGRTIDILSNGFKIRDADSQINEAGKWYLYAAWAENPFKTARAR